MRRYRGTEDVRPDYVAPRPGKALQVRLKHYFTSEFLPLCARHDSGGDVGQELLEQWAIVGDLLDEYCVPPLREIAPIEPDS